MEEATIRYANTLSKEHKVEFIEYLKVFNSNDMDELVDRHKKMGVKKFRARGSSFQTFLMTFFETKEALDKLLSERQSHST
uniref:Uncharacterized protein n=1 Tax=viral metagenome TaxID=1070528 RepID=A0A6C0EP08_9ZZZZ